MIAETVLWQAIRGARSLRCAIMSGCGGVDLLVTDGETIIRRERHADRSTACERGRELRAEFERSGDPG